MLISLGSEGALFLNKEQVLFGNSPKGIVVNTACAGDSLLGAFLAGWLKQKTIQESLKEGLAAGSSTAFRKGLPNRNCPYVYGTRSIRTSSQTKRYYDQG